jgi:hypothetical protein
LNTSIDRRGVTFIGGGDPLGPAPGEVAPGVAPLGGGGTRGGAPPEILMGYLPCNPSGPAPGEAPLGMRLQGRQHAGEAAPGVAHPYNPNEPAAPL